MKNIVFIAALMLSLSVFGQDGMRRVPKMKSFEIGYENIFNTSFNGIQNHGYSLLFDYAWQLSGFNGKKAPGYISVPIGYTSMATSDTNFISSSMYYYGWTVRHYLGVNKSWTPFLGYALMLTNLRQKDIKGSIMGHLTRFEFGFDHKIKESRCVFFAKVEYGYRRFPERGNDKSLNIHNFAIKSGVRF